MNYLSEDELRHKHDEEKQELYRQLKDKDSILHTYKTEHGKLEVFFNRVLSAVTPIAPLSNKYNPKYDTKVESPVVAVSQYSDWHTGEMQESDEIEGFNAYNPQIQEKRLVMMDEKTIKWMNYHRDVYRIDRMHVLCTGDFISGDIHDELRVTNAYPTPVQVVEAAKYMAASIAFRVPHFAEVVVDFIAADNHARLTKKPQFKEEGLNSLNYLVGILAKEYLSKHKNVEFNIHPLHEKIINVNGMKYLVSHGHDIKGWMGIPWYSIERKIGREARARMQIIMSAKEQEHKRLKEIGFNKYIFGHWHTNFDSDLYSCSASLSGTNALDHAMGRFSFAGQPSWMVHPKHGEFDRTNFVFR